MKYQLFPQSKKAHLGHSLFAAALLVAVPAYCQTDTTTMTHEKMSSGDMKTEMKSGSKSKGASSSDSKVSAADKQFANKAAMGGMAEVKLGNLAEKNGGTSDVKELGSMLVKDHTKANEELMSIASKKGINLPSDLDEKHKAECEAMSKLSGDEFDKAYLKAMEAGHKKTIALFETETKKGEDADLKKFATDTVPTLQKHLEHIQKLQSK